MPVHRHSAFPFEAEVILGSPAHDLTTGAIVQVLWHAWSSTTTLELVLKPRMALTGTMPQREQTCGPAGRGPLQCSEHLYHAHQVCPHCDGACVPTRGLGSLRGQQAQRRLHAEHNLLGPGTGQKNSGLSRPAALRPAPVLPVRTCPAPEGPNCLLSPLGQQH